MARIPSSGAKFDAKAQTSSAIDKLFGVRQGEQAASGLKLIEHAQIEVRPQARTIFPGEEVAELARSIAELRGRGEGVEGTGILQPLLVMPLPKPTDEGATPNGARYRLIAGERRYRASQQAGLPLVPCLVVSMREDTILAAQLIENLQRQDLAPLDKARSFQQLMQEQGLSYRDAAQILGKSRSYISDYIALLSMDEDVQNMVSDPWDTLLHARLIQSVEDADLRTQLIQETLAGASRRAIERRISGEDMGAPESPRPQEDANSASSQDRAATSSRVSDRSDTRADPVRQCLDPAVALLAEGARQLGEGHISRAYTKQVRQRLEEVRRQIEQIENSLG